MKNYLFIVLFLFFVQSGFSQVYQKNTTKEGSKQEGLSKVKSKTDDPKFKENYQLALDFIAEENFKDALPIFIKLDSIESDNSNIQFNIGMCYIKSVSDKIKAIPYLEKAIQNVSLTYTGDAKEASSSVFSFYFLGQAYSINYEFDKAIECFIKFVPFLTSNDKTLSDEVNRRIEMCYNGKKLREYPVDITIKNLGVNVNSKYSDYSPVVSADESTLIFTSRREESTGGLKDPTGQYYEDIYITNKDEKGNWKIPVKIGTSINTNGHEASIGLSPNGRELFIYKDDGGDGNIYSSKFANYEWTKAEKLGPTVNTKFRERHASITDDGKTLYFTSDRPGGFGGLDIYKSEKQPNGEWGKAINLGNTINTIYDEEAPYILADGATLYFSSKGHESMGGFDIFVSTLSDDGFWSKSENVGYPINTTEDDVFYVPTQDEKRAYYSSAKAGGYGGQDIYYINIIKERSKVLNLKGLVMDAISYKSIGAKIQIIDNTKNSIISSLRSDNTSGEYYVSLNPDKNYTIRISAENYKEYLETFDLKTADKAVEVIKDFFLERKEDAVANNLSSLYKKESKVEDENLAKLEKSNLSVMPKSAALTVNLDELEVSSKLIEDKLSEIRRLEDKLKEQNAVCEKEKAALNKKIKQLQEGASVAVETKTTEEKTKINMEDLKVGEKIILRNILFDYNKSKLRPESEVELNRLLNLMNEVPTLKIEIAGHTDNKGSAEYNKKLSKKRAKIVVEYLVDKGISKDRMIYRGYGFEFPIATNTTDAGRQENRRTEFKILSK